MAPVNLRGNRRWTDVIYAYTGTVLVAFSVSVVCGVGGIRTKKSFEIVCRTSRQEDQTLINFRRALCIHVRIYLYWAGLDKLFLLCSLFESISLVQRAIFYTLVLSRAARLDLSKE